MKRTSFLCLLWLSCIALWAVPAHKGSVRMSQPDGTMLTLRLVGDEYLHYNTTDDGYSVVRNRKGAYVYATLDNGGQLAPTAVTAHDADGRTAAEMRFLQGVSRYMAPAMTFERAAERQAELSRQASARARHRAPQYDYTNFRGLLILVEFNDRSFSRTDIRTVIDDMVNREGYTGYMATNGRLQNYTGSVRDYFSDQSVGLFKPSFDVCGPYKIDYSQYDAKATNNAGLLTVAALAAADPEIDYSLYDRDGDGWVDMVYFIFAGLGSNFSGNDSRLFWPHRSIIVNPEATGWYDWMYALDGVSFYDYASSVELYGYATYPSSVTIDGIGTICHEFGHVLGLPDLYDTDYEDGGGQSSHPGEWSIMAGGSYQNYGRTPVGYTLYERYAVGFVNPVTITEPGSYTLQDLATANTGYRINTLVSNEYFLIENRQQTTKWDRSLPGHGMLVFRVDSTDWQVWQSNRVNCNPAHNYLVLLRAGGTVGGAGSDPFPGTARVTQLNNQTSPANLLTWSGQPTQFGLLNIAERSGLISFDVEDVYILRSVSLPESVTVFKGVSMQLHADCQPAYAPHTLEWTSADERVATVNGNGLLTGVSDGQTTITVRANDKFTATCRIDVITRDVVPSFAEVVATAEGYDDLMLVALTEAQVLYVNNNDCYMRDATGPLVIRNVPVTVSQGNVLTGVLGGRPEIIDRLPYLHVETVGGGYVDVSEGLEPEPVEVRVQELADRHYGEYITLHQAQLVDATVDNVKGVYATDGQRFVRLYNTFDIHSGVSSPKNYRNRYYDITGILLTRQGQTTLIDELAMMKTPVRVEAPTPDAIAPAVYAADELSDVYTLDGQLVVSGVARAEVARLPLRPGLYLVRSASGSVKMLK